MIIAIMTLFSPSPLLSVKRGDLPSTTQRMYTPAKQSACCSPVVAHSTESPWMRSAIVYWIECPYSCDSTRGTPKSPAVSRMSGISPPRSQPMVLFDGVHFGGSADVQFCVDGSAWHHIALYTSYVSSPQNLPCLKRSSHEKSSVTGLNLPLNHVGYAPVQNCSISAIDNAASLSTSPLSPLSIGRVGPGAPGRKPEGSSVTGLSATCVGLGGGGGGGAGGFC